ncbi:unnamed protein product [Arctia plantaginis]|uniref:Uncharacterized protein n=1 Tax=Arctia plantaginis TaxID=874455 RepID=A0A8S0YT05_ARCPL|nr:unnamed protein product [Arctia plantaginis]
MKVARLDETFPQAELRRLEQTVSDPALRAAELPEQSQARHQQHAEYLASTRADETPEQSQSRYQQHSQLLSTNHGVKH